MTSQQTLSAAALCISEIFPDSPVYAERIPQGFSRPCFFITACESEKPLAGQRVALRVEITVARYAGADEDAATVGREAAQTLSLALEWLRVDERPRHCLAMSSSTDTEKGITTFKFAYAAHLFKKRDETLMRRLSHSESIK